MKKIFSEFYYHAHNGRTSSRAKEEKPEIYKYSIYLQSKDQSWIIRNSKNTSQKNKSSTDYK